MARVRRTSESNPGGNKCQSLPFDTGENFFQSLERDNQWYRDELASRISLLAVYIPILRDALSCWAEQWNRHRIRRQANRPYVIPGQPIILWQYPEEGVENYRQPVATEQLEDFRQDLEGYGMQYCQFQLFIPVPDMTN